MSHARASVHDTVGRIGRKPGRDHASFQKHSREGFGNHRRGVHGCHGRHYGRRCAGDGLGDQRHHLGSLDQRLDEIEAQVAAGQMPDELRGTGADLVQIIDESGNVVASSDWASDVAPISAGGLAPGEERRGERERVSLTFDMADEQPAEDDADDVVPQAEEREQADPSATPQVARHVRKLPRRQLLRTITAGIRLLPLRRSRNKLPRITTTEVLPATRRGRLRLRRRGRLRL